MPTLKRKPPPTLKTALVRGLLLARSTDLRLQQENLSKKYALESWVVEAGPAFYQQTIGGVKKGIDSANAAIKQRDSAPYSSGK